MAHLYFVEQLPERVGEQVRVCGAEARHAVSVARLKTGEQLLLADGAGRQARVVVRSLQQGKTPEFSAQVLELRELAQAKPAVYLVQALAKQGRDERAVELCTELGVDVIIPWQAARSVSVWQQGAKALKGQEKWQKIAHEAAKQSLRPRIPQVEPLASTQQLCALAAAAGTQMFILHPWQDKKITALVSDSLRAVALPERVVFVVGPEGGLSPDELKALTEAGALAGVLGENVLRTSSAGAAALAVFNVLAARW